MYTAGTVTVNNGSKTVTGAGTAWLANAAVGNTFSLQGGTVGYQIEAVPGDGTLTLVETYGGSSASGQSYTISNGNTADGLVLSYPEKGDNDPQVLQKLQATKVGAALAAELSVSVAGSSDVTLTNLQARNGSFKFTGALTGNINVIFPAKARLMWIYNNTSGAYTLTVVSSGSGSPLSGGIAITQGKSALIWCDGTNMRSVVGDLISPTISGTPIFTGIPSLVGGALSFPATQVPSAGANDFDDCEKGTFTPVLKFGGGTTGITYIDQIGRYVKLAKGVLYFIRLALSSKGSSSGAAQIFGFPFTLANVTNAYQSAPAGMAGIMATMASLPLLQGTPNTTTFDLYQFTSSSYSALTEANFQNTSFFNVNNWAEATA